MGAGVSAAAPSELNTAFHKASSADIKAEFETWPQEALDKLKVALLSSADENQPNVGATTPESTAGAFGIPSKRLVLSSAAEPDISTPRTSDMPAADISTPRLTEEPSKDTSTGTPSVTPSAASADASANTSANAATNTTANAAADLPVGSPKADDATNKTALAAQPKPPRSGETVEESLDEESVTRVVDNVLSMAFKMDRELKENADDLKAPGEAGRMAQARAPRLRRKSKDLAEQFDQLMGPKLEAVFKRY